ncbi:MAG: recombinase family protein [Acidimicrobiales bacterium]|jgi:DNA invertase Pin-like site-specific DNA recombinase
MMLSTELTSKVTTSHLERDAYVYVRQSTITQVREHTESLERQYELAARAQDLGWAPRKVVIVDDDLGRSGADATAREGFKGLVADVGLGKVGMVLGIEVSRLARNNADWYQLLDLCAITDTLIADGDGLYHPADFNDRLVLGLKGTMSEAELHLIRHRLTAGLRHKAAKGDLRQGLPVGFVHDEEDAIVLDPDESVRAAIATVFRRFDELGSGRQVMLSLREDNLLIPRRPTGSRRVSWAPASYPAIHDFLTNPNYAGAFVFGRTRTEKRLDTDGRIVTRTRMLPRDEWEVLIVDHHPGYITWERYERLQDELRANWRAPRGFGGGPVREGTALLQGRLRCGRCGRMMRVGYSGTKGNCPRYVCAHAKALYGAEHACQSIGGRKLEARVLDEVFAVLEPASLAATAKALAEADTNHRQKMAVFELAAERARYAAERARRQFDAVEPENRLVARTLEGCLEEALSLQRQAEGEVATQRLRRPTRLTDAELQWLERAGADVRAVFDAPSTTWRERKQLLRAIVAEVTVTVRKDDGEADAMITWEGGATTAFVLPLNKTGGHFHATDEGTVELLQRLAERYDDKTIAMILSKQRRLTATGLPFTKARVASLRVSRGIGAYQVPVDTPSGEDGDVVSLAKASEILHVSRVTLYRWLADGFIVGEQLTVGGPWHIRLTDELRARLAPAAPEGWVGLDQAAKALGVARQTVLHRVQRGELRAVQVTEGKRKGLRIEVNPPNPGLFDTTQ